MPLAIAVLNGAAVSGFPKTRWINQLSSNREETMKNLYVGNLEKTTTEEDLETAFAIYGSVELVSIIRDQTTGLPREFGFMEMTEDKDALEAVQGLNGYLMTSGTINVSEARAKTNTARVRTSK